jgi:hypothetical protein
MRDGDHFRFEVGTQYNAAAGSPSNADALSAISLQIWPLLGQKLARVDVEQTQEANRVVFEFESGRLLSIWQEPNADDNLLIVTDLSSAAWSTVL